MNAEFVSGTAANEWVHLVERDYAAAPETAFARLVERQSRFVFQVAYAVLRNVEDAEDVVQDTFFKLLRTGAWKQIQDERRFLARVAWRLAVDRRPAKSDGLSAKAEDRQAGGLSPEATAIAMERSRRVHRLIDSLPEKLRRPLALSSIEEMTATEIAAVMELPEGTVRRLLIEGRALVKEKMLRMEGQNRE